MATTTSKRSTGTGSKTSSSSRSTTNQNKKAADNNVEAAADRIRELNERIIESSKKAGNVYLDTYEKTLNTIADYQERVGQQSNLDWVKTLTDAQADFTRQLASTFASAGRNFTR